MDNSKLKVLLINHSDNTGGAAVVSTRLMNALCAEGVDARMLVVNKTTDSLRVAEAAKPLKARVPFLAEHADIYLRNGMRRDTLFRISTGRFGLALHTHPWLVEADAVILNWVNQGMLSFEEIERIARIKPVIWTMHDQWNMTGICHYTDGCERWCNDECRACPLAPRSNMAHRVFLAKKRLYSRYDIRFVAVSRRLAELCRRSPLMADADITVIPNAMPVDRFPVVPEVSRRRLGIPDSGRLIVMGASRLDDPVKGLPLAIDALNRLHETRDSELLRAVFYGRMRNPDLLTSLRMPHVWLGPVDMRHTLPSLMAHADVVLSTSVWETLPGTVVEGIAAGAVGVATSNGGQSDIIDDGVTGCLVEAGAGPDAVARAIGSALAMPQTAEARLARHQAMAERFGAPAVARAYLRLVMDAL